MWLLVGANQGKAKVLAENASAALEFRDIVAAGELLKSLSRSQEVLGAAFYDKDTRIFAKYEQKNMTGSIKDRMALWILRRARESGALKPGDTIAEATSHNNWNIFYLWNYLCHKSHCSQYANVTASFHTFCYHSISTSSCYTFCKFYIWNYRNYF